jgi:thioredoxin-like negative regulator of GroEL
LEAAARWLGYSPHLNAAENVRGLQRIVAMSILGGMRGKGASGGPFGGFGGGSASFGGGGGKSSPEGGTSGIATVSERDFEREVLRSEVPVLVQFTSARSQACKAIAPDVEAFAREMEGKVKVLKVDIEKSVAIAKQLRLQSIPTFMVFAQGRVADAVAGPVRKAQMREMVDPFLPRAEGALKALELAELIKAGAVVPIDTREKAAFDRAHLPGAKHMPLDELETRLAELHMLAGQPVLYCRSGDKTKDLAARLAEQEVPVAFLEGGLLAWESEGLKVERP